MSLHMGNVGELAPTSYRVHSNKLQHEERKLKRQMLPDCPINNSEFHSAECAAPLHLLIGVPGEMALDASSKRSFGQSPTLADLRKILRTKNWKPMTVHASLTKTVVNDGRCRELARIWRRCPQEAAEKQ